MDTLGRILAVFLLLFYLLVPWCRAQTVHGFNWATPGFSSQNVQECQNVPVAIQPLNTSTSFLGVPPYYMLALEVGGITSFTPIGDDPKHLVWQNTHRRNAQLLLTVQDSAGQTGGFPVSFYNAIPASDGADTSCLIPAPTASTLRITPDITTTIQTCQPWRLTVTGGTKPYNVTFGQLASPVITNVTMGPEDDVFTFIDRATPGQPLMAAVADATGQWGVSTVTVNPEGSTDTDCVGLVSTSSTKAQIQAQEAAAAASAASQRTKAKAHATTVALAIVFGVIMPPAIVGGIGFWWWRRHRKSTASQAGALGQDARPPPGYDAEQQQQTQGARPSLNLDMSQVSNVVRVSSQGHRTPSWAVDVSEYSVRQTDSPTSMDMSTAEVRQTAPTPFLSSATLPRASIAKTPRTPPGQAAALGLTTPNSTSPAATLSPEARYRKALEAHAEAQANRARRQAEAAAGGSGARPFVQRSQSAMVGRTFPPPRVPRRAGSSLRLPPVAAIAEGEGESEVGPDIIIQHRDGGLVEELPPPYRDSYSPRARGARARSQSRSRSGLPATPRSS